MTGTRIKRVTNNKQKGNTFKLLIEKYNAAISNGFYGEAELIVYAFLEDRLRSFLYYCNALDRRNSRGINENMQSIFGKCNNIDSINTKLDIIETSLRLVTHNNIKNDYSNELVKIFKYAVNVPELKREIKAIRKWCAYRNEIVHAMFNKDMDDLRCNFKEHVELGYAYARYIDKQVSRIKKV